MVMPSLLLYSVGHTDQFGTKWEGMVQSCEHQEVGITGGHVGLPHVVTGKSLRVNQMLIWENNSECSWIQSAFPLAALSVLPSSFRVPGWYRVPGTSCLRWNIWPALHFTEAKSGLCCRLISCVHMVMGRVYGRAVSPGLSFGLCFPFFFLYRKGSWRNWKGHWWWPCPFPHWQGPDALHRSHHHGGSEAERGGTTLHPSHDLRENRQVQGLPPRNAPEGRPSPSSRGLEVRAWQGFVVMDNQMSRGCFRLSCPLFAVPAGVPAPPVW